MICPNCGAYDRFRNRGKVRGESQDVRTLVCLDCEHVFATIEMPMEVMIQVREDPTEQAQTSIQG